MRVAFFSAHDFERQHFIEANADHGHELVFFKEKLNPDPRRLPPVFRQSARL